jgi:hypothetical protein
MAKAHLTTKQGTTVVIEGTPAEVAALMKQLEPESVARHRASRVGRASTEKPTPVNLIGSLIDGGFFKKPKDLGAVKTSLEEMGHHYPVTTLSPALLRLVRKRQLRRLREGNRWLYTGG